NRERERRERAVCSLPNHRHFLPKSAPEAAPLLRTQMSIVRSIGAPKKSNKALCQAALPQYGRGGQAPARPHNGSRRETTMQQEKGRVALTSILASGVLTLAKAVVGLLTGSLAILSEAAHSLIDFGATVMTYFAVRISSKPADEEHHYGHGKVESITAL